MPQPTSFHVQIPQKRIHRGDDSVIKQAFTVLGLMAVLSLVVTSDASAQCGSAWTGTDTYEMIASSVQTGSGTGPTIVELTIFNPSTVPATYTLNVQDRPGSWLDFCEAARYEFSPVTPDSCPGTLQPGEHHFIAIPITEARDTLIQVVYNNAQMPGIVEAEYMDDYQTSVSQASGIFAKQRLMRRSCY